MDTLPIFPLGSVLFPGAVLPLQVFEPRYQQLVSDLPATGNRFGVVLIRRGHEVGGGDERYEVGTVAEVVIQDEIGEGLSLLTAVGRERFRVIRWLDDDPYPRAEVDIAAPAVVPPDLPDMVARAAQARQQLMAVAIELGADGQQLDVKLPEDPEEAAWALCTLSPAGSFDRQRLLEMDDATERLLLLEEILHAHTEDLRRVMQQ